MKKMKELLSIFLLLSTVIGVSAQNVSYRYDDAGNRTERVIVLSSLSSPSPSLSPASVTELEDMIAGRKIKIYPNPTEGMLAVEIADFTKESKVEYLITDMSGKTISRKKADSSYTTLDLTRQRSGIYILRISINGENTNWKIIKK
jgi:YD repeat-containing protein